MRTSINLSSIKFVMYFKYLKYFERCEVSCWLLYFVHPRLLLCPHLQATPRIQVMQFHEKITKMGQILYDQKITAYSLSKICKIVLEYTLKCSQLISSSDNKKILLTTRNVRLDSGRYATKYYCLKLAKPAK